MSNRQTFRLALLTPTFALLTKSRLRLGQLKPPRIAELQINKQTKQSNEKENFGTGKCRLVNGAASGREHGQACGAHFVANKVNELQHTQPVAPFWDARTEEQRIYMVAHNSAIWRTNSPGAICSRGHRRCKLAHRLRCVAIVSLWCPCNWRN